MGGYDDDKVNVGRYTTKGGVPRGHFKGVLDELVLFSRGLTAQEVLHLYQDGCAMCDLYVDAARGRDWHDGRRPSTALATIQRAINLATPGDVIGIYPGVYCQEVRFLGRAITVRSIGDVAFIECRAGPACPSICERGRRRSCRTW